MPKELIQINSAHVKGDPGTGFEERGDLGDFVCGNCEYFKNNSCGQADMLKLSKRPRTSDNRVKVGDRDCCEYVDRQGRREYGGKQKLISAPPKSR